MSNQNTILRWIAVLLCLGGSTVARAQRLNFNSLLSGSQFLAPATFQLSAYAEPSAGRVIQKIEFYSNENLLGEAVFSSFLVNEPYANTLSKWKAAPIGANDGADSPTSTSISYR